MTDRYGLSKNMEKFGKDWRAIREAWRYEPATQIGWTHRYVQAWVTASRHGAYLVGHVDAVMYPVLIAVAIAGWV